MTPDKLKPGMKIVYTPHDGTLKKPITVKTVRPCTQQGNTHINETLCFANCTPLGVIHPEHQVLQALIRKEKM